MSTGGTHEVYLALDGTTDPLADLIGILVANEANSHEVLRIVLVDQRADFFRKLLQVKLDIRWQTFCCENFWSNRR